MQNTITILALNLHKMVLELQTETMTRNSVGERRNTMKRPVITSYSVDQLTSFLLRVTHDTSNGVVCMKDKVMAAILQRINSNGELEVQCYQNGMLKRKMLRLRKESFKTASVLITKPKID